MHILAMHPTWWGLGLFVLIATVLYFLNRERIVQTRSALIPLLYYTILPLALYGSSITEGDYSGINSVFHSYGSVLLWLVIVPLLVWLESIFFMAWIEKYNKEHEMKGWDKMIPDPEDEVL